MGQRANDLLHIDFGVQRYEVEAQLATQGYWDGELTCLGRDRGPVIVASRWTLDRDNQGAPRAILQIGNDVTRRRLAERALWDGEHPSVFRSSGSRVSTAGTSPSST
jgi:PAS domain-containing protein